MADKAIRGASLTIAVLCVLAGTASAATIRVENEKNAGTGSLRKAIADAADGDRVKVPRGDYEMKTGPLVVATDIDISGAGQKKTIVSAKGSGVFEITSAAGPVSIEKLTITGGRAETGGGVLNAGDLLLRHATVKKNRADDGGGIATMGLLQLESTVVSGNRAKADFAFGGGIHASPASMGAPVEVTLIDSTLKKNQAVGGESGFGGGVYFDLINSPGLLRLDETTVANNSARGKVDRGFGGGIHVSPIFNDPVEMILEIERSTVSGNLAKGPGDAFGGGVFFQPIVNAGSVSFSLENSTVFGNESIGEGSGRAFGGAMHLETVASGTGVAPMSFSSSTISANRGVGSTVFGGGLYVGQFEPAPVTFNTIVAGNEGAPTHDCLDPLDSIGGNLESGTECGFTDSADIQNANPKLRDLADNGGPTKTAALKGSSPAVDAGASDGCLSVDQRGVSRPQGLLCDIGAFELED